MEKIKNQYKIISLVVVLFLIAFIFLGSIERQSKNNITKICANMRNSLLQSIFDPVLKNTQAKSIYTYNFSKNEEIFSKNSQESLPLASLTKLMTVRIALKNIAPLDFYTIKKEDLNPTDGTVGFVAGDSFRIVDLVKAALIASSNDAATMLANSTNLSPSSFLQIMNIEARSNNLPSLYYQSVTGLDIKDTTATAFGNAHDILNLLYKDYLDFPEMIKQSSSPSVKIYATNGDSILLKNTDIIGEKLSLLVASKTGYTDVAQGNLAILWHDPKGDLLGSVVLGSSENGRFSDTTLIYKAVNSFTAIEDTSPIVCANIK